MEVPDVAAGTGSRWTKHSGASPCLNSNGSLSDRHVRVKSVGMPLTRGTRFGRYEITDSLGAGGIGEVYRGRDSDLQRDVAIKVLPEPQRAIGTVRRRSRSRRRRSLRGRSSHRPLGSPRFTARLNLAEV